MSIRGTLKTGFLVACFTEYGSDKNSRLNKYYNAFALSELKFGMNHNYIPRRKKLFYSFLYAFCTTRF